MNQLPLNWVTATISDIAEYISRGKSPKYTEHSTLPVINQKAIRWFGIEDKYLKYVHPDQIREWEEERFIQEGDILWNSTGRGTMGRACLISPEHLVPPKVVDSHVTIIRPFKNAIDPRYLFAWIRSPHIQDNLESLATGATNQIELGRSVIVEIELPLAPFNEQKRIAEKLDSLLAHVDSCLSHLERVPSIIKSFRQSVLAAATSGRLTEDWRGERGINKNWKNCFLGDVITDIRYGTAKKSTYDVKNGKPVLRIPNIIDGKIDPSDLKFARFEKKEIDALSLKVGDLLLIRSNGSIELVGKLAIVDKEFEDFLYAGYLIRLRFDTTKVNPRFISHYLSSPPIRNYIEMTARSTSGINNINSEEVKAIPLELPSLKEQAEILRRIKKLFTHAERLEARYQSIAKKVDHLTPLLLEKAFRGELVEQNPNDEPAKKLLQRVIETRKSEAERRKAEPRKKKEKKMRTKIVRKSLYETLLETGRRLTPEDLFTQAGFDENSIDEFYEELRAEIKKKRIEEIRQGTEKVYLRGASK